jgi:hypothetical protein
VVRQWLREVVAHAPQASETARGLANAEFASRVSDIASQFLAGDIGSNRLRLQSQLGVANLHHENFA